MAEDYSYLDHQIFEEENKNEFSSLTSSNRSCLHDDGSLESTQLISDPCQSLEHTFEEILNLERVQQDSEAGHQHLDPENTYFSRETRHIFDSIRENRNWSLHHFVQSHMRVFKNIQDLQDSENLLLDLQIVQDLQDLLSFPDFLEFLNLQDKQFLEFVLKVAKHFNITNPEEYLNGIREFIMDLKKVDLDIHFSQISQNNLGSARYVQRFFRAPEIQNLFRSTIKFAKINLLRTQSEPLRVIFGNQRALELYDIFLEVFYLPGEETIK